MKGRRNKGSAGTINLRPATCYYSVTTPPPARDIRELRSFDVLAKKIRFSTLHTIRFVLSPFGDSFIGLL